MRFLIDANLPRSTARLLNEHGHEAVDVRDLGPGMAADAQIARHARTNGLILISADFDFSDIRVYPPEESAGILVINRPQGGSVAQVLAIIERVLDSTDVIAALPGRLAIADAHRVRLRPALPESGEGHG